MHAYTNLHGEPRTPRELIYQTLFQHYPEHPKGKPSDRKQMGRRRTSYR